MPARLQREPEPRQPDRNEHRQQEVRGARRSPPGGSRCTRQRPRRRGRSCRERTTSRDVARDRRGAGSLSETEVARRRRLRPDRAATRSSDVPTVRPGLACPCRQAARASAPSRTPTRAGHLRWSQRQPMPQAVDLRAVGPHHLLAASPGAQRIRERPKLMNSSSDADERHSDDEPSLPSSGLQHRASPDLPGEEHGHDRQREFAHQKADREHDAEPDRSSSQRPGDQHEEERQNVAAAGPDEMR